MPLMPRDQDRAEKSRSLYRAVAACSGSGKHRSSTNDRGGNHLSFGRMTRAARNQDAYLRLLLGASGDQAEAAEREAEVLVRKEPRNWLARATLGLARLRLGRD